MRRTIGVAAAVIVVAACGSTATKRATTAHTMSLHEAPRPAKPIPVLPSGLLDVTKVDLSGTPGVSPQQQRAAEHLLRTTITSLTKWLNYKTAIADGFISIGDNITGWDHVVHWDWINDGKTLDASRPESLVYKVDAKTGARTLESAMYFLDDHFTLDNTPATYGPLIQYHTHPSLCFVMGASPHLAGIADAQGHCAAGTVNLLNAMAHVWIRPNECGPFAPLPGIGGGTTKSGTHLCDHAHGDGLL